MLRIFSYILGMTGFLFFAPYGLAERGTEDQLREFLRNRIETAGFPAHISVGTERIHAQKALPRFYQKRGYLPAWIGGEGPQHHMDVLVKCIKAADREGLNPEDYHLKRILANREDIRKNQKKNRILNPGRWVDLDLLLTDAFLMYGSHLLSGRINPESVDPEWVANRRGAELDRVLENALNSNGIEEALQGVLPAQSGYGLLKHALARYRGIVHRGGWATVSEGPVLKRGDRGKRVAELRTRLSEERWSAAPEAKYPDDDRFDEALESMVRDFQCCHGLNPDGVVGQDTLSALNVSAETRVRQVEINMERWRWLPEDLGNPHLIVNMADFVLCVTQDQRQVMEMRVIVGKGYRRTPVFSGKITYLVFSPYWQVPPGIAVKDKLPLIKKDPAYLLKQHMRVFQGWNAEAREIDPASVDWARVNEKNFPYRLRQDPGPDNALGKVKFMFPNRFNVYLHDTSSPELFEKTSRTFSSGCIRIQKPIELAEYLLKDDPRWNRQAIQDEIAKNTEKTVILKMPVDIHLLYWTVFVDNEGILNFRKDIYGRDARLMKALDVNPPKADFDDRSS